MVVKENRHIKHDKLEMAAYLNSSEIEEELSKKERQYLVQCIVSDFDIRANRPWKIYRNLLHCLQR